MQSEGSGNAPPQVCRRTFAAWLCLAGSGLGLPAPANAQKVAVAPTARPTAQQSARPMPVDIARIVARGELVVAMLGVDTPPFFHEKAGALVGLEVDMARELAQELQVGLRFNRQAKTFNEVIDVVARKEADLGISKLSRTLARAQVIRFSDPYLKLRHALVLNRDQFARLALDRPLSSVVRQYSGKLGVIAKSSFADYAARNFPQAQRVPYASWEQLVDAVQRGEVPAAYRDEFEVKRLLKSTPTASLSLRTVTFKDLEDSLGIAVGVDDPTLLAFVNQFLVQRPDKLDINRVLRAVAP